MPIADLFYQSPIETDGFLPEGPREVIVNGRPALAWVNIQSSVDSKVGSIHIRFWDNGEQRTLPQAKRPGFFVPTSRDNIVLVGREKEIGLLDLATNHWKTLATIPDTNPRTIINDGEPVPSGRAVVFGTKDIRFQEPIAHLYSFDLATSTIAILADKQLCSNGKVIRQVASGLTLFDIDTPKRNIVQYRLNSQANEATFERVAIDLSNEPGFPDGMIDDGQGGFIVAYYNPQLASHGRIVRYDASGKTLDEWHTPGSPRVTCPALVKQDGRIHLIATSATEGMPDDMRAQCPNAGSLFIAETFLDKMPETQTLRLD
jgi:sugar lactone lactonase YvrE